jgi:hypothetical protein
VREIFRRAGVSCLVLSLVLLSAPSPSDAVEDDGARAVAMLQLCSGGAAAQQVAQAAPSGPSASATPTPSPSPTPLVGPPSSSGGPQVLVPQPLPTAKGPSPVPLPSTSPGPAASPSGQVIEQVSAPPSSSPLPAPSASAGLIPSPSPAASAKPQPGETLSPNDYAILGDHLSGIDKPGEPKDLDGHVTILYQQGVLGGDHAHYDGKRYIDITGHPFIKNAAGDTTLFADSVRFDTVTQKATLINGRGESTQGVEQGKLHFKGTTMVTDRNGVTHVERANLTTCENPRGGYHLESKTLDIYPGDKAVAKSVVVFLGALAILYLPVVVISLRQEQIGTRRNPGFIPLIGYDQAEGFWVKARIGFSPSEYYYGYYRIEEYTKIGLGLGYVGTLKRKDGKRQTDINFFRQANRLQQTTNNNLTFQDQENFSQSTRGSLAVNYTSNYGPLTSLPAQLTINAALDHGDTRGDRQNYNFQRTSTGSISSTNNYGFSDHLQMSPNLQNDVSVSYTDSTSGTYYGVAGQNTSTLHYQTLTHYIGRSYDYNLIFDRYDSSVQSNVQKEPELQIRPLTPLFPNFRAIPITSQYTLGFYNDPAANIATSRGEARLQFGPSQAHVLGSDFSATVTAQQDYYGTGDEKAQIAQQASLSTPLFGHLQNTISYNESHVNGPLAQPFTWDPLSSGLKQANDVLRVFNGDAYTFSLTATTFFNRQAQALGYQLQSRPSSRSTLLLSGSFQPGPGFGFDRTSVQIATPFGYKSDLQIATFIDWKNHMRLVSKNIYYRHIVGDCYELRASYNEDLKQVYFTVTLLAFPSQTANFGIGQPASLNSVIPGNFSNAAFTTGASPYNP